MRQEFIDRTENPFRGLKQNLPAEAHRVKKLLLVPDANRKFSTEEINARLEKAREAYKSGNSMRMLVACSALKEIE